MSGHDLTVGPVPAGHGLLCGYAVVDTASGAQVGATLPDPNTAWLALDQAKHEKRIRDAAVASLLETVETLAQRVRAGQHLGGLEHALPTLTDCVGRLAALNAATTPGGGE